MTLEPWLVEIGDNVTISGNVKFVTHDNSVAKLNVGGADVFGQIKIGNNCFIGQNALLMYGVELANNTIVAAGSVVCNSFDEERIIIGGNPAQKIGTWNAFAEKCKGVAISRNNAKRLYDDGDFSFLVVRKAKQ